MTEPEPKIVVGVNDAGITLPLRIFPATKQGYEAAVGFVDTLEGVQDGLYYIDAPEIRSLPEEETTGMTIVYVVLTTGDTIIVEVEEEVTDAMRSVDRRIDEGEPISGKTLSDNTDMLFLIPPRAVKFIAARP